MKIINTLLLVAVASSLAACEKTMPDTANPADGVETPEAPETPDAEMPEADDLTEDGAEEEGADEAAGDAEAPTAAE